MLHFVCGLIPRMLCLDGENHGFVYKDCFHKLEEIRKFKREERVEQVPYKTIEL